jgi:hypothetical protein
VDCRCRGLKASLGGRPPRIPDWLRRAIVADAEKELDGLDPETILATKPASEEMSEAEKLAHLDRMGVAILVGLLRPAVGEKNRNGKAIAFAAEVAEVRELRVDRGEKQRTRLDWLIEDASMR